MLGCCTYLTAEDTNSKVVDVVAAADVEVGVKESIYDSLVVGNSLTIFFALAHYCSLISRIQSLIGSQRRCHADALSPALAQRNLIIWSPNIVLKTLLAFFRTRCIT